MGAGQMAYDFVGTVPLHKGQVPLDDLLRTVTKKDLDWNEAETRFRFIDLFLTKCLGWPRPLIHVETREDGTYTDYELREPRSTIWEAKRVGKYFDLPANPARKLVCSLKSIMQSSVEAEAAIQQAQGYCSSRGVQFAVICNGHQLVAFLATRWDGTSPFDGGCLAIDGYLQLKSEFPRIWQNLSPEGVGEKRLYRLLTRGSLVGIPRKLSSNVLNYHRYRYKSDTQSNLRTLAELLIEDIPNTPELEEQFYRECYCESGALSQYALVSKSILNARYAALFPAHEASPPVEPLKPSKDHLAIEPGTISEALSRRPFVLIGDVGVGKTSFLKHLIYRVAREEFGKSVYVYIDLGSQAALEEHLEEFVRKEFARQLFDRYGLDIEERNFVRGVYHAEIQRFRTSIYGDLYDADRERYQEKLREFLAEKLEELGHHLTAAIRHIVAGQSRQVILIIDNADQRSLIIQQDAFIIAQSFASETSATVFIAVRPQTYHRSRRSGSMSAYPQKVFTISPPRVDRVVEKRLTFALKVAEGELPLGGMHQFDLHVPTLSLFIQALLQSLQRNERLVELLSNITGGNIRAVIELVRNFIGSPNVESDKIIRIMQETGDYTVPVHEFGKSAILGEFSHFHEDSSLALNVFDVRFPDQREHFLIPLILGYLNHDEDHRDKEGFVRSDAITEHLQTQAFTSECPSSKHLGLLSLFYNGGSGSSWIDVKPLVVDGSSGGVG